MQTQEAFILRKKIKLVINAHYSEILCSVLGITFIVMFRSDIKVKTIALDYRTPTKKNTQDRNVRSANIRFKNPRAEVTR